MANKAHPKSQKARNEAQAKAAAKGDYGKGHPGYKPKAKK